jgi:DNA-binding transcriptional LysR family regulator
MSQVMARFLPSHPNVRVMTNTAMNNEVIESVVDHRADLGLVLLTGDESAAATHDLCAADLVCLLPHGHPLTAREVVTPAHLAEERLISYSSRQPIGALMDVAFEKFSLRRVVAVEITQSVTACALVATGTGIAVVDGYALLGDMFPNLIVRPFQPRVRIVARLLQAQHRPLSRIGTTFVGDLRTIVNEHIAAGKLHVVD